MMLIHPCEQCGSNLAVFGFRRDGHPSHWYCRAHRHVGEAWLRGDDHTQQHASGDGHG